MIPVLDRRIAHEYGVVNLMDEVHPEFRVPVAVSDGA